MWHKIISLQRQARAKHHLRRTIGHLLQEDCGKVSCNVSSRQSLWINDVGGMARIAATTWPSSWSGSIMGTDLRQEALRCLRWYQDSIKMSDDGEREDTGIPRRHPIHEYSFLSNNRLIARDQYEKLYKDLLLCTKSKSLAVSVPNKTSLTINSINT